MEHDLYSDISLLNLPNVVDLEFRRSLKERRHNILNYIFKVFPNFSPEEIYFWVRHHLNGTIRLAKNNVPFPEEYLNPFVGIRILFVFVTRTYLLNESGTRTLFERPQSTIFRFMDKYNYTFECCSLLCTWESLIENCPSQIIMSTDLRVLNKFHSKGYTVGHLKITAALAGKFNRFRKYQLEQYNLELNKVAAPPDYYGNFRNIINIEWISVGSPPVREVISKFRGNGTQLWLKALSSSPEDLERFGLTNIRALFYLFIIGLTEDPLDSSRYGLS